MIRLNLTAAPEWLELAPGLRLQVAPLTTALMVSARADAALEALPEEASQEELALVMAKSLARRAVLDWEGVGDAMGTIVHVSPDGIDALLEIWPVFEASPYLNGFIIFVFLLGVAACFWQVLTLISSVSWIESFAQDRVDHDEQQRGP